MALCGCPPLYVCVFSWNSGQSNQTCNHTAHFLVFSEEVFICRFPRFRVEMCRVLLVKQCVCESWMWHNSMKNHTYIGADNHTTTCTNYQVETDWKKRVFSPKTDSGDAKYRACYFTEKNNAPFYSNKFPLFFKLCLFFFR